MASTKRKAFSKPRHGEEVADRCGHPVTALPDFSGVFLSPFAFPANPLNLDYYAILLLQGPETHQPYARAPMASTDLVYLITCT